MASPAQMAAERAEQIRLGLQSTAVLYAKALQQEDWRALGYPSLKAWVTGEFGPARFSAGRRREIVALLTRDGWTQREIAAAAGASQDTVKRDQAEARELNRSQEAPGPDSTGQPGAPSASARQQAARDREARKREAAQAMAEVIVEAEQARQQAIRSREAGRTAELALEQARQQAIRSREAALRQQAARAAVEVVAEAEAATRAAAGGPGQKQEQKDGPAAPAKSRCTRGAGGVLYSQDELDAAALEALRAGKSQTQFAHDLGIGDNLMRLASAWRYAEIELARSVPGNREAAGLAGARAPESQQLLPGGITGGERLKIQGAYDALTAIGRRSGWEHALVDQAHQSLGVILAVLAAERPEEGK